MKNQFEINTTKIVHAIGACFETKEENEDNHISIKGTDPTELLTSLIYASYIVYKKLTGGEEDVLRFTHLANSLVVQHLLTDEETEIEEE